ncbi:serine/threonine-protein kinase VRK1-like isoform X2 [Ornithodoros turicata]
MPKRNSPEEGLPQKRKAPKKAASAPRIASNGHRLPDPLPQGVILTDVTKKQWRLGCAVGLGGFGEIYLASDQVSKPVTADAPYVVKIEPHSNGPLFAEMHFYYRVGKQEQISNWIRKHQLDYLGMPRFMGSGSHDHAGSRYRFMVMERFGEDLQKVLDRSNRMLPVKTAYTIGRHVINILEYIHSFGYIHADVKASNLLLGYGKGNENKVYLVDFGLACRYRSDDGTHKEYKEDLRKAHDGTIEFTSRDAHIGAHSRRGDLEILGYNILQWLCGRLPWEDNLRDPEYVSRQKSRYMADLQSLMKSCFPGKRPPAGIMPYLQYVAGMEFDQAPDYKRLRKALADGIRSQGQVSDGILEFPPPKKSPKLKRVAEVENSAMESEPRQKKVGRSPGHYPSAKCRKTSSTGTGSTKGANESGANGYSGIGLDNPTPAMLQVLQRRLELQQQESAPSSKSKRGSASPTLNGTRDQKVQTVVSLAKKTRQRPLCSTASQTSPVDSDEDGGCSPEI